jgi:hypothetical protein
MRARPQHANVTARGETGVEVSPHPILTRRLSATMTRTRSQPELHMGGVAGAGARGDTVGHTPRRAIGNRGSILCRFGLPRATNIGSFVGLATPFRCPVDRPEQVIPGDPTSRTESAARLAPKRGKSPERHCVPRRSVRVLGLSPSLSWAIDACGRCVLGVGRRVRFRRRGVLPRNLARDLA